MKIIGYAPGVWDCCHIGHLKLLWNARAYCDRLYVGVLSDAGAEAYKRRPIQDQETRLAIMKDLRMVDMAFIQETTDPTAVLESFGAGRPHVLFHGNDWQRLREGHESLARLGVQFQLLPYTPGISTSDLIARMLERETVPR